MCTKSITCRQYNKFDATFTKKTLNIFDKSENKRQIKNIENNTNDQEIEIIETEENEEDIDDPVSSPKVQEKYNRIDTTFQRIASFKKGNTMANTITNAIGFMITKDNVPLSIVENEGFQQLMRTVARLYKFPSRKIITKLLDLKYEILKRKFINNIKNVSLFTITCDIWTDVSNKSYGRVPLAHIPIVHIHSHRPVLRVFPLDHQSENFILN